MEDERKKKSPPVWRNVLTTCSWAARWVWHHASVLISVAVLVGVFLLGLGFGGKNNAPAAGAHEGHEHPGAIAEAPEETIYYCSMHPQIRQPEPGICPICNMELVPMKGGGGADAGERVLVLSDAASRLAEIQTSLVERRDAKIEIRMVGKVDYDETLVKTIAAWIPGRIERLHADFTGMEVAKGDPLVDIYSPDLYVAQKELLLAHGNQGGPAGLSQDMNVAMLEAAREKLRLWGLTVDQIASLEAQGRPSQTLTIPAPISGTIVKRAATQGMYVREGTPLLTVADLSMVWVILDAYESDLGWLSVGQGVTLTTTSYPGVELEGEVRFIGPFVDERTRTARVRVEVTNRAGLLKPGMFAKAHLYASVSARTAAAELPLVVPATAVLRTGKRAVVYVKLPDTDSPAFEGRTVVLGPRAGDYFVVESGVEEGEEVVTNGAFRIDSALQIQAKPSMMSMPSEEKTDRIPAEFLDGMATVYDAYFRVWDALQGDKGNSAAAEFGRLHNALPGIKTVGLSRKRAEEWSRLSGLIMTHSMAAMGKTDIKELRGHFESVSEAILAAQRTFGHAGQKQHYHMYCPMAHDNQGASWLQESDELLNPYFGAAMLQCGETRKVFEPGTRE